MALLPIKFFVFLLLICHVVETTQNLAGSGIYGVINVASYLPFSYILAVILQCVRMMHKTSLCFVSTLAVATVIASL